MSAHAALLPANRLHLQHGPIDLIIGAEGDRRAAFRRAASRFDGLLASLASELPHLRSHDRADWRFDDPIARRMARASAPHDGFVTPMAAVAGAVADEVLNALIGPETTKAYVNNGGDVAVHVSPGQILRLSSPAGPVELTRSAGVATSGWRGRSHSLGIADAVTVVAADAAAADVAATLIANAVDLPGDPRINRVPARDLAPDSDLGTRLVTTYVQPLDPAAIDRALHAGSTRARSFRARSLIHSATLHLQGVTQTVTAKDLAHA